ncbi:fumarylacetoacetate hydrolase family protein [Paenibacillus sp. YYML68]|uniref:fumarylacetoacetate hydrolase family protein n=1 Tax=Paenibacillus sp. YYML68 TaxID=2909250 RepID=UPI002491DA7A|nr:fumarylacetoacetate hydrolase family protein [Paenibacillus sp. YYML68]
MEAGLIRNIYCVGRNYGLHAAELGNSVPDEPMIFTKPTHAAAAVNGGDIVLPGTSGAVHYEVELVLYISATYCPGNTAVEQLVDRVGLGIDFTLRDVQETLKRKGYPWLPAKGFRQSAALTETIPFPGLQQLEQLSFALARNGVEVQRGQASEMIFSLQTIVDYVGTRYGLGAGDVIYTGTPAGVGAVGDGDLFELTLGEQKLGSFRAALK